MRQKTSPAKFSNCTLSHFFLDTWGDAVKISIAENRRNTFFNFGSRGGKVDETRNHYYFALDKITTQNHNKLCTQLNARINFYVLQIVFTERLTHFPINPFEMQNLYNDDKDELFHSIVTHKLCKKKKSNLQKVY